MTPCPACRALSVPFAEKHGYAYRRCRNCGLLFVWPRLERPPEAIYRSGYFEGAAGGFGYVDYDAEKEAQAGAFGTALERCAALAGGKGSLLDVGAATGWFVGKAAQTGWTARGIDVSEAGVAAGRAKGVRMDAVSVETLAERGERFDVVTMWDVLEHFPDPFKALDACARLTRPGGILALVTPDGRSIWARLFGPRWHALVPPEHLTLFNPRALKAALDARGFDVVRSRHPVKAFTLAYILSTALRWAGRPLAPRAAAKLRRSVLAKFVLPVPIGDNLLVYARRR